MIECSYLSCRYKVYEESLVGLNGLMDNWIRALGEVKPKKETEPTSGVEDTPTHTATTSKRKSRKEVRDWILDINTSFVEHVMFHRSSIHVFYLCY